MSAFLVVPLVWLACYLVGAVPFGYLVAKAKGVDLFRVGSGNIGATNVGRVLGRKFGVLVFLLDFLKGAVPVGGIVPLVRLASDDALTTFGSPEVLKVGAAAFAFLGHLFPVYLGFRGGKGVATGAGAVAVLVPGPFLAAVAVWVLAALVSRTVSLASILAVIALSVVQLAVAPPRGPALVVTGFCLVGSGLVILRHRANVGRLIRGTESQIGDGPMRLNVLRVLHVVAAGLWVGGAGFFNFVAAPSLFATFEDVVKTAPSDRTANVPIVPPGTPDDVRKNLGSALAGAAVGPIFPKYFALQLGCAVVVLATAWPWRGERFGKPRVQLAFAALASVAVGWWVSAVVGRLRLARYDLLPEVAQVAREQFATWHLVSLGLSFVTILLAFALLVLAGLLPPSEQPTASGFPSPRTRATAHTTSANAAAVRHVGASPRYSHAKATKTASVITSCISFSCVAVSTADPILLAGTCSAYSGSAISQLTRTTPSSALSLCFRWPYHATVMKTLDAINSSTVKTTVRMIAVQKKCPPSSTGGVGHSGTLTSSVRRSPARSR